MYGQGEKVSWLGEIINFNHKFLITILLKGNREIAYHSQIQLNSLWSLILLKSGKGCIPNDKLSASNRLIITIGKSFVVVRDEAWKFHAC